jgi:hypothetical protein
MPGSDEAGLDSEATAKTLRLRAVWAEPQSGHLTPALELMDLTSFSNWLLQDLQVYS